MKVNAVFLGFDYDYEKLSVSELKEKKGVRHLYYSRIWKFLSSQGRLGKLLKYVLDLTIVTYVNYLVRPELVVFKDDIFYLKMARKIKGKKAVIFRNVADEKKIELCKGLTLFTFDKNDAENYSMKLYNQFTPAYELLNNEHFEEHYDATFIGYDKGRKKYIDNITSSNKNVRFNIVIVEGTGCKGIVKRIFDNDTSKSYEDFVRTQYSTRCVLEITQNSQYGETMRFIEALIAKKKVITNNKNIYGNELYRKNNVYVIDNDDRTLSEFIDLPFEAVCENSLKKYSSFVVLSTIIDEAIQG